MILILALLVGLSVAGWNTWHRLGRSQRARAWSRSPHEATRRGVLVLYPLFAVACVSGSIVGLTPDGPAETLAVLVLLAALATFLAYFLTPMPTPGFVKPTWYVRQVEQGGRADG